MLERLLDEVDWNSDEESSIRRPYGRDLCKVPRQQTAYGEPGTHYAFSGSVVHARPWIPVLLELRDALHGRTGFRANFVLVNHYRSGADYMGWHSDDERDMGPEPELYSLTLGAARDFQFRRRAARGAGNAPPREIITLPLASGSLLHMQHPTNRDFKHQLPRRGGRQPEHIGPRVNLTWRRIAVDERTRTSIAGHHHHVPAHGGPGSRYITQLLGR